MIAACRPTSAGRAAAGAPNPHQAQALAKVAPIRAISKAGIFSNRPIASASFSPADTTKDQTDSNADNQAQDRLTTPTGQNVGDRDKGAGERTQDFLQTTGRATLRQIFPR